MEDKEYHWNSIKLEIQDNSFLAKHVTKEELRNIWVFWNEVNRFQRYRLFAERKKNWADVPYIKYNFEYVLGKMPFFYKKYANI